MVVVGRVVIQETFLYVLGFQRVLEIKVVQKVQIYDISKKVQETSPLTYKYIMKHLRSCRFLTSISFSASCVLVFRFFILFLTLSSTSTVSVSSSLLIFFKPFTFSAMRVVAAITVATSAACCGSFHHEIAY